MSIFEEYPGLKLRESTQVIPYELIKYELEKYAKIHKINEEYHTLIILKNYGFKQVKFEVHSCGEIVTLVIKDDDHLIPIMINYKSFGSFSSSKSFMLYLIVDKEVNINHHLDALYEFYLSNN